MCFLCAGCTLAKGYLHFDIDVEQLFGHKGCVADWLEGQQLMDDGPDSTSCIFGKTDPYPPDEFPDKKPKHRRFFLYKTIAKRLGAKGAKNRAKLPGCVEYRIRKLYDDKEVSATKVGYKQA